MIEQLLKFIKGRSSKFKSMRKALSLIVLTGFLGIGSAVVGGPNASEGEMAITSGSSEASAAVDSNGTQWKSKIENLNSSCRSPRDKEDVEFDGFQKDEEMTVLSFRGTINTSNPCSEVSIDVEKTNESNYKINLIEDRSDGVCTQCTGTATFNASFSASGDYLVQIIHDGEVLGSKETPSYNEDQRDISGSTGVWEGVSEVLTWFGSLF
jgi:hypothetical protein